MPYLYPDETITESLSDEDFYIVCLSEKQRSMLITIAPMLEWANDHKYVTHRDWAEDTLVALIEAIPMQNLVDALTLISNCVCEINGTLESGGGQGFPHEYPGENPGWEPSPQIPPFVAGSTPPASTGASTYGEWVDYFCKSVGLIREAVLVTLDELRVIFSGPVIYIGAIVAIFGVIVAVLSVGGLPVLILSVSTAIGLANGFITMGLSGIDAAQVFFEDDPDVRWRDMVCLMIQENNADDMTRVLKEYLEVNAPSAILPFINFFPWKELIQQALIGEDANGIPLADVSGFPDLCDNCFPAAGSEMLDNPEMDANLTSWYLLPSSPCSNEPSHINGLGAQLGCNVSRSDYATNFTVLSGDVGTTLTVSWALTRAGSAVGALDRVRIAPVGDEYNPVIEWSRANQTGGWTGLTTWSPSMTGDYVFYFMENNSGTTLDRASILRP